MFAAVEWTKVLSRFAVVGLLCCFLAVQHVFNTTGFYKCGSLGIDDRSRWDLESCAGDASSCTGVLCRSSKSVYGGVV